VRPEKIRKGKKTVRTLVSNLEKMQKKGRERKCQPKKDVTERAAFGTGRGADFHNGVEAVRLRGKREKRGGGEGKTGYQVACKLEQHDFHVNQGASGGKV